MLLLLPLGLLLLSLLVILVLAPLPRPSRYTWLVGIAGGILSWGSLFGIYFALPQKLSLPFWRSLTETLSLQATPANWSFALALLTTTVAVLLSDLPAEQLRRPLILSGNLVLAFLGLAAVFSATPLTLVFLWSAIDLSEWVAQARSASSPQAIRSLSLRLMLRLSGTLVLLWAGVVSLGEGQPLEFGQVSPGIAAYLFLAAALRLGVVPLHLPYGEESLLRRGFGTLLRMAALVSALTLVIQLVPPPSVLFRLGMSLPLLFAALLGAWSWLTAANALDGRPFWIIATSALAMLSALYGNAAASLAWGVLGVVGGSLLFLLAFDHKALRLVALSGWWALSGLPFSLVSPTFQAEGALPFGVMLGILATQLLLGLGYLLQWQKPRLRWEEQPSWVRNTHFPGILGLAALLFILGFWRGVTAGWSFSLPLAAVTWVLFLLRRRLPFVNRLQAHWIRPERSRWERWTEIGLRGLYWPIEAFLRFVSRLLEGESGLLWSLLILIAIVSLLGALYR